jgi:acetyl-CoA synthetase
VAQPDDIKGTVPIAFITLDKGHTASDVLMEELRQQVISDIGSFAKPDSIYFVESMPKTRSGKIIRRMLREIMQDGTVKGDITGLEDSDVLDKLVNEVTSD